MAHSSISKLPMCEEEEATGEISQIYTDIKREMELPFVPNIFKAMAGSPSALAIHWSVYHSFFQHTTLPQSLTSMILYSIATIGNCVYCSTSNELNCRMLGVDDQMLSALVKDLPNVSPERLRVIIEFAIMAAHHPQHLAAEDYDRVRAQGVSDAEIIEIIQLAAIAKYSDTLADALKIEVETMVTEALGQFQ